MINALTKEKEELHSTESTGQLVHGIVLISIRAYDDHNVTSVYNFMGIAGYSPMPPPQ